MNDPRPNQLAGQVQPNTLSSHSDREPATTPVAGQPGRASTPALRTANASRSTFSAPGPNRLAGQRAAIRRPFRIWALIVAGIVAINFVRALGAPGGSGGGADATIAADATTLAQLATGHAGSGGDTVAAVEVPAGTVVFGTSLNEACDVSGSAKRFAAGTSIWWYAHLNVTQAGDAKIVTILKLGNVELDRGTGPTATSGVWDGLCAGSPFNYGSGSYRFEIWNDDEKLLLASGEYEIAK
jgi:hypothetical protein